MLAEKARAHANPYGVCWKERQDRNSGGSFICTPPPEPLLQVKSSAFLLRISGGVSVLSLRSCCVSAPKPPLSAVLYDTGAGMKPTTLFLCPDGFSLGSIPRGCHWKTVRGGEEGPLVCSLLISIRPSLIPPGSHWSQFPVLFGSLAPSTRPLLRHQQPPVACPPQMTGSHLHRMALASFWF